MNEGQSALTRFNLMLCTLGVQPIYPIPTTELRRPRLHDYQCTTCTNELQPGRAGRQCRSCRTNNVPKPEIRQPAPRRRFPTSI